MQRVKSQRDLHFLFYLDGLCFTAPGTSHDLSFLFLFCLSVRVCVGVGVEVWRAVGRGRWGYLWFISGKSSKKPVDAASLSCPLCPSHCFSIGLPLCRWHTCKCCPALPMLPSWSRSCSGHSNRLPAKRTTRDQSHSAILAPPLLPSSAASCLLRAPWPQLAFKNLHSTWFHRQHEWNLKWDRMKRMQLFNYNFFWVSHTQKNTTTQLCFSSYKTF